MLLALRRWLGLSAPVVERRRRGLDRKPQKWVIEPARVGLIARAEELWRYRRILWFFASRRINERYEDKTLGRFWLFFQPLAPILISTVIFGSMLEVPSDGVPYFLFFLTGMSCWRIFERGVHARDAQPGPEPRAHQEGLFPAAHRADLVGRACAHRVRRALHAAGARPASTTT